jgi:DNA-binding SARP family transcriptional activator
MESSNQTQDTQPLLRITTFGPLLIECLDASPQHSQRRQYVPLSVEQNKKMQGKGAALALSLLKILLSQPARHAPRDVLMELLWPDTGRQQASDRLDDAASTLRCLLRPAGSKLDLVPLVHGAKGNGNGYQLAPYPLIWVDAEAFLWYVEQAARLERFGDEALPLWERAYQLASVGPYLAGEPYSEWASERRHLLAGQYRQCVHQLAHLHRTRGEYGRAEQVLRGYVVSHRSDEDALRPLLELWGSQERYQEALEVYEETKQTLALDGQGPDSRTQDIAQYLSTKQIRRKSNEREQSGLLTSGSAQPQHLPSQQDEVHPPFSSALSQGIIEARPEGRDQDTDQCPSSLSSLPQETVGIQARENGNESVNRREAAKTIGALGLQLLGVSGWEQLSHALMTSSSASPLYNFLLTTFSPINEETLDHLEQLGDVCWHLANKSQEAIVTQILPTYLPKLTVLAGHPSPYRKKIAQLVTRGYILAAEVEKKYVVAMQAYCEQAVIYSEITTDDSLKVDALRQKATIALIAKEPSKAVLTYQQALPMVNQISPLLRSRIYLGLASASARTGQKQEALSALGLARDSYPDVPEDDPAFLYLATSSDRSAFHLYEALTYSDLQQADATWNALMKVDGMQPKIPVLESARIEFLNLQARTAAISGKMEVSCDYLIASVKAAKGNGYLIWVEEAYEVYLLLCQMWPHEKRVQQLGGLFHR